MSLKLYLVRRDHAEHMRRNVNETEVLSDGELGTLRELSENGKPVFELALDRAVSAAARGTVFRLAWTGGSWASKSVQ